MPTNQHPYYPGVLKTTEAASRLLLKPNVRVIEVDFDPNVYLDGHIESAVYWDWQQQLRNPKTGRSREKHEIELLLSKSGIRQSDTILLYGDNNNWFACYAFWILKMVGHPRVFLIDGGARKWFSEGRMVTESTPEVKHTRYRLSQGDPTIRASLEDIFQSFFTPLRQLVDVRTTYEYQGIALSSVGTAAECAVGGHIPTSVSIPWNLNCNPDGTFRHPDELRSLYGGFGVTPDHTVISYCAVGERASLTWFVLKHLLDYPEVMVYDVSMAGWSHLAHAPIITGDAA